MEKRGISSYSKLCVTLKGFAWHVLAHTYIYRRSKKSTLITLWYLVEVPIETREKEISIYFQSACLFSYLFNFNFNLISFFFYSFQLFFGQSVMPIYMNK